MSMVDGDEQTVSFPYLSGEISLSLNKTRCSSITKGQIAEGDYGLVCRTELDGHRIGVNASAVIDCQTFEQGLLIEICDI